MAVNKIAIQRKGTEEMKIHDATEQAYKNGYEAGVKSQQKQTENCSYCKENERAKIKEVVVTFRYENPKAYGYPEICNWEKSYTSQFCPICNRRFGELTEKGGDSDA